MVPGHKLLNSVYKGVPRKVPLLFGVKEVYMKGGGQMMGAFGVCCSRRCNCPYHPSIEALKHSSSVQMDLILFIVSK